MNTLINPDHRSYCEASEQDIENLNDAVIPNAEGPSVPIRSRRRATLTASVEIIFDDLEAKLVEQISRWPVVVGCMAWLTNEAVLHALTSRKEVSILIQKEDFLRPDAGNWSQKRQRKQYLALPTFSRMGHESANYSFCSAPTTEAIRCVGIAPPKGQIKARMHHKFMVFCDSNFEPQAVWTGSFNATFNGGRSLENAVILKSKRLASAYMEEWATLLGISESLDWNSPYVAPEFRIGT